jgi:hypothetical protein
MKMMKLLEIHTYKMEDRLADIQTPFIIFDLPILIFVSIIYGQNNISKPIMNWSKW